MIARIISEIAGWLAVLLVAILAAVLIRKKLHKKFPLFFYYLVMTELTAGIRFLSIRISYTYYFYTYWISDVVLTIFAFLALYELFIKNLFVRFHKVRFYRFLFPLAALIILIFTALAARHAPKGAELPVAASTFDLLRAIVLMFFVTLVLVMGREWKKHEFAIALGFGIYASTLVAYAAFMTRPHRNQFPAYALLPIAYDVVCIIWLFGFWGPEQITPNSDDPLNPELLDYAKTWEKTLRRWLFPTRRRP